ncbi:histidine kinase [Lachnospiraceae bacterium ZAX-1]
MKNMGIKSKIVFSTTLIIVVFSFVLGAFTIATTRGRLTRELTMNSQAIVAQANFSITEMQKELLDITLTAYLDPKVLDALAGRIFIPAEEANELRAQLLNQMILAKHSLAFVELLPVPGNSIGAISVSSDASFEIGNYDSFLQTKLYRKLHGDGQLFSWEYVHKGDTAIIGKNHNNKLLFGRRLLDIRAPGATIGYLLLGINESTLLNMFSRNVNHKEDEIFLCDEYGEIIFRTSGAVDQMGHTIPNEWLGNLSEKAGNFHFSRGSDEFLVTYNRENPFGWVVFYSTDTSRFQQEIVDMMGIVGIVIITVIVLHFLSISVISKAIISPLKDILHVMEQVETGNFKERLSIKQKDEIGILAEGYNKMADNITSLIDEYYIAEIKRKDAELAILYAQINPHFLYNILDLFYWQAMKAKEPDIADNIYALSHLLHISLNRGHQWIPVEKDMDMLQSYCKLQNALLVGKLRFHISCDEQMKNEIIPSMILQPFVENAILHGLKPMEDYGELFVSGSFTEEFLIFEVSDNGVGMTEKELDESFSGGGEFHKGYGIKNVMARLLLYYESDYSVTVKSVIDQGTTICIMLKRGKDFTLI